MGSPDFSVPTLKKMNENFNVVGVFTQPPRPSGRGMSVKKSPIQLIAEDLNLKIYTPTSLKNNDVENEIINLMPDYLIVVAYGLILPEKILKIPKYAAINGHASLLPKWRGASPIQRSIEAGEKETGCTSMLMEKGLDTGPILLQKKIQTFDDDVISIYKKLSNLTASCLLETIEKYSLDKIKPIKQNIKKASYAHKLNKKEGKINWKLSAEEIFNKLKAFKIFPGIYTYFNNEELKIIDGNPVNETHNSNPGTILNNKNFFYVACGKQTVFSINLIQKPGKNILRFSEFLRGSKINVGEIFD
tara:strand:+ start:2277 stop:3185 length:909 start_codon:yes stop_codon:yes gene_type:complete